MWLDQLQCTTLILESLIGDFPLASSVTFLVMVEYICLGVLQFLGISFRLGDHIRVGLVLGLLLVEDLGLQDLFVFRVCQHSQLEVISSVFFLIRCSSWYLCFGEFLNIIEKGSDQFYCLCFDFCFDFIQFSIVKDVVAL